MREIPYWIRKTEKRVNIYLDQNKWIELSKAIINNDPAYGELIKKIDKCTQDGSWILPLSILHLTETAKRADNTSRTTLTKNMERLAKGYSIAPYESLDELECENSIRRLMGLPLINLQEHAIKQDPLYLIGMDSGNVGIISALQDEDKIAFTQYVANNHNLFYLMTELENITGISKEIREDTEFYQSNLNDMRQRQLKMLAETAPKDRKHLYSIYLLQNYIDRFKAHIFNTLNRLGISQHDFYERLDLEFSNKTKTIEFLESIPGFNVSNRLIYDIICNPQRNIDKNDFYDITFLSVAVPYCDIVITENLWADRLHYFKLDEKYNTIVSTNLDYLLSTS